MTLHLLSNRTFLGITGTPLETATRNASTLAKNLARQVQTDFDFARSDQSPFSNHALHQLRPLESKKHHVGANTSATASHQTIQTKYICQDDEPTTLDDLFNPLHSKNGRMRFKKPIKLFQARATPIQKHHSLSLTEQFYRVIAQIDARQSVTVTIGGSDQHDIKVSLPTENLLFTLKWSSLHNDKLGFDLIPHSVGLVHVDAFNNQSALSPNTIYFIEHNEHFEITTERGTETFSIPDPLHIKDEIKAIETALQFFDVANTDLERDAKSKFKRVIRQYHPDLQGDANAKQFVEAQQLWKKLKQYKGWK